MPALALDTSMYTVRLTAEEYDTTEGLSTQGYFPESFFTNLEIEQFWSEDESEVTLGIPENIAWELINFDEHALYTCMSRNLVNKWEEFSRGII